LKSRPNIRQGALQPEAVASLHYEHASVSDRHGGLFWHALLPWTLVAQGHAVKLMPAEYLRPFVRSNKNDYVDAEAIAEAVQRPTMRFVPIKNEAQLDMQALHRVRDRWIGRRTAVINQLRGFLLEHGITVATGPRHLRKQMPLILEDAANLLSPRMRMLLMELRTEWDKLEEQIDSINRERGESAKKQEGSRRLLTIPGIGPRTATAPTAAIGNATAFHKSLDLAGWVDLVPRQHFTGGESRLLSISKRGDPYLRRLLSHGARSVLAGGKRDQRSFGEWLNKLEAQPGMNVKQKSGLNKAILDQGWAEFRRQLEYKMLWAGGLLLAVPPKNTSAICPSCGRVSGKNRQTQAVFACVECGYSENADLVGAINVRRAGHARFACEVNSEVSCQQQEPTERAA